MTGSGPVHYNILDNYKLTFIFKLQSDQNFIPVPQPILSPHQTFTMANHTNPSPLPALNRYITTHAADGTATIDGTIPTSASWTDAGGAKFFLGYCTSAFPADLSKPADISSYNSYLSAPPGLVIPGGTVLRIVDMQPGQTSAMHRTTSLDYGVVLEGEVELILDGGETRVLKRGDTCVQRGTNHAWRNTSATSWSRMLYVLSEAKPVELEGGKKLEEDLGGMVGVRKSGESDEI
ncbi:hypothetical protein B0O99DRAFT_623729 [Bisporella sp. PMI_857]|nr:hypothetical protein B0O99DRAFT_623729 [Bisporella sp. PMI_857]